MAKTLNRFATPYGLTDAYTLQQARAAARMKQSLEREALPGREYLGAELGTALGSALRGLFVRQGWVKDEEMDRATSVTKAQERARLAIESRNRDMAEIGARSLGPSEQRLEYGRELIAELSAAGLHSEADLVRTNLMQMYQDELELQKLEGDVRLQGLEAENKTVQNRVDAATEEARIARARAEALKADVDANVAFSTENLQIKTAITDFEMKLEELSKDRAMRPWIVSRAASDAAVAKAQAALGGTVPELVRLQAQRDHTLEYLVEHPDDKWAQQRLTEINSALQTKAYGIQRNIDNYQPTTATLSAVQASIIGMEEFATQGQEIIKKLNATDEDAFGGLADLRTQIGGWASQGASLVGMSQETASSIANFMISDNALDVRSEARQLRADLSNWLSKQDRMTPTAVDEANSILQVLDNPAVSRRDATIALTNFVEWVSRKQATEYAVLQQGMSALVPNLTDQPVATQFEAWLQGSQGGTR